MDGSLGKCRWGGPNGVGRKAFTVLPPWLSLPLGLADVNSQRAPCFLPDLLADADHHGHHGHRDPECGWEHLCEPGGYCSLLSPRKVGALHPQSPASIIRRADQTSYQGHQGPRDAPLGNTLCAWVKSKRMMSTWHLPPPSILGESCLQLRGPWILQMEPRVLLLYMQKLGSRVGDALPRSHNISQDLESTSSSFWLGFLPHH